MYYLLSLVGFAGTRIWLGWAIEEVRGGPGPHVVAFYFGSSLNFPVHNFCVLLDSEKKVV